MPFPVQNPSDKELVDRCRRELPYVSDAFEELVRRHRAGVHRTCVRLLGSMEDAEEASQDVFLRVSSGLAGYEGRSSFRTWLYRIVVNVCSRRRGNAARGNERRHQYRLLTAAFEATSAETAETTETTETLMSAALDRLGADDREILVLRYVTELPVGEVAEVLGLGLSAAKMRVSRAAERLRDHYEEARRRRPGDDAV